MEHLAPWQYAEARRLPPRFSVSSENKMYFRKQATGRKPPSFRKMLSGID